MDTAVNDWVAKPVEIIDGISENIGECGVVLAVDDKPWRPSAWVKVGLDRDHPSYRSCDLCWLQNTETGECGPVWGTGGPDADMERFREHVKGT
jgi:hypothetical protein